MLNVLPEGWQVTGGASRVGTRGQGHVPPWFSMQAGVPGGWVWGRNVRRALFDIGLLVPSDDERKKNQRCAQVDDARTVRPCSRAKVRWARVTRACVHSKANVSEQSSCRARRCAIWRALAPSALALTVATRAGCRRMARDGARGTHAFERKSGEVPTRPTGEQSGEGG